MLCASSFNIFLCSSPHVWVGVNISDIVQFMRNLGFSSKLELLCWGWSPSLSFPLSTPWGTFYRGKQGWPFEVNRPLFGVQLPVLLLLLPCAPTEDPHREGFWLLGLSGLGLGLSGHLSSLFHVAPLCLVCLTSPAFSLPRLQYIFATCFGGDKFWCILRKVM